MSYRVLLSAASTMVYEDLMCPEEYDYAVDAGGFGERIKRAQGLEYEVMRLVDGEWRSVRGETAVEVIRRRWQA